MKNKIMNKRGVYFSTDALIALIIILVSLLIAYPIILSSYKESEIQSDIIKILSNLKTGEIDNYYIKELISSGQITDLNKSLLEQIGEFYVKNITIARNLANSVLSELDISDNIGIWYGNTLIYSRNSSPYDSAKFVEVDRQIISGIAQGDSVTGYSARAYLSNEMQSKYFYFGGFFGEGNISININYSGNLSEVYMEIATNKDFDIYINDIFSGHYTNSTTEFTPARYDLSTYRTNFHSGNNIVKIVGDKLYIAGGYFRIIYGNSSYIEENNKYYFPGIEGIINLYDGFYVPEKLNRININLHYNSSYYMYLNIGNKTVYNDTSNGNEIIVNLNNSYLSSILNYSDLFNKTIPIRLGLEEIMSGFGGNADVILITDVSGSMDWRMDADTSGTRRLCNDPLLTDPSTQRLSLAKCLDINFTRTILSGNGNRIGLVSFSDHANDYVNLTTNFTLLNDTISKYTPQSGTCIACALNRANLMLKQQSSNLRKKFIIVMTDGVANMRATTNCVNMYGEGIFNENNPFSGGESGILFQRNSDSNWNKITNPVTNSINDIDFYNSTFGFAVGNSGVILRWNGASWSSVSSPTTTTLNGIDLLNESFGLGVGDSGIIIKWNGTQWLNLGSIANAPKLYSVSVYNSTFAFAVGLRSTPSSSGRIYKTINGGITWTEDYNLGSGTNLRGIKIINSTLAYAVGNSGVILRWNGASWSSVSSPLTHTLYRIDSYNNTEIYAVGGNSGSARIIKNNGISWSNVYSYDYSTDSLRDVVAINGKVYTIGINGMIVEYNGSTWKRNFNISEAYFGNLTNGIYCNDDDYCLQPDSFSSLNSKYSACKVNNETNSTIYSIGFGRIAQCSFANQTLKAIADCGNGSFYASSDADSLKSVYEGIAYDILRLSYSEQLSNASENIKTTLYPDSYIEFDYNKPNLPYGLINSFEKKFLNSTNVYFDIPENSTIIETKVISYSGPRWTDKVIVNNHVVYNLSIYGNNYVRLGDPYSINIPNSLIQENNSVLLTTGINPSNSTNGSISNKIIYRLIRNVSSFTSILSRADGCIWNLEFQDETQTTIKVPSSYFGTDICYYKSDRREIFDENDAIEIAVFDLLKLLDLNNDGKIDLKLTENNLVITSSQIDGIPYSWSTQVQVRRWL
ncbi:MAG: VWA domain-containing protein [Candidatus Pacearchaeota archaeon]